MLKWFYRCLTGQLFICSLSGGGANGNSVTGAKSNQSTQSTTNENRQTYNTTTNTNEYSLDAGVADTAIGMAKMVSDKITSAAQSLAGNAFSAATDQASHAYDYADNIFSSAVDFANNNDNRALGAFDRAATIVNDNASLIQAAYADAKGTTDAQKQIVLAVIGMAAVVVVSVMFKKGG